MALQPFRGERSAAMEIKGDALKPVEIRKSFDVGIQITTKKKRDDYDDLLFHLGMRIVFGSF